MASDKSMFRLIAEGTIVGHPLHVMLIHFPIGLWGISLIFDLAWLTGIDGDWLLAASRWCMAIGTVFALFAGVTGIVDWLGVRRDHPAQKALLSHMAMNIVATGIYILNTFMRFTSTDPTALAWIPIALSVIGYGLVMVSGYLGGVIIYEHGIGVGRHRKETTSPEVTLTQDHLADSQKNLPETDGFTPIAQSADLPEDGTLRVKLKDHDICLVRYTGRVYAVQEYCTHRYGPLSEGAIHNGCLECPWHNSCFNLTTGEPVSGPAKVPLKTFLVQEMNGMICVQVPAQKSVADKINPPQAESPRPERASERDWERPGEKTEQEKVRKTPN